MYVNVLSQRDWIESVLSNENPRMKIWNVNGIMSRNKGFQSKNNSANTFLIMVILFLIRPDLGYQSYQPF